MRIGQTTAVAFASKVLSSVVGFVATVYLARVLGAGVLGTYFLVVAVVIWLQVVGVMGVQSALTKRISESGDGDAYAAAGLGLVVGVFAVLAVAVVALSGPLTAYLGAPVVGYVLVLLLLGMLYRYVVAVLRGQHLVHVAAVLSPVERTVRSALQVGVAVLGFGLVGLLAGYAVGAAVAVIAGAYFVTVRWTVPDREHLRRVVSFARYAWLGQLGSRAFSSMDTVVLGVFVSSTLIGYYEIAWNLASILAVFGTAVSEATYPEMSEVASDGDLAAAERYLRDALSYAGLLLVPGLVGAAVVGERVLAIYGQGFPQAYGVLLVLVAARLVYAYGNQLVNALNGIDRPEVAFRVNAAFVAGNLGLNVVLVGLYGWVGAAVATAVSAAVAPVLGYYGLSRFLDVPLPVAEVGRQWAAAGLMGVAVLVAGGAVGDGVPATVSLVGLGAATYFLALSALSAEFRGLVRRNLAGSLR